MLINLSNHPSNKWQDAQLTTAKEMFGDKIVDISFPDINPNWGIRIVRKKADEYFDQIRRFGDQKKEKPVIHLSGELTFCVSLASKLLKNGYEVITSTSERVVKEENNVKTSIFKFKDFREYELNEEITGKKIINKDVAIRYWALSSILGFEVSFLMLINTCLTERRISQCEFYLCVVFLFVSIISLCILFFKNRKQKFFTLKTKIASKIFANIIKPEVINVVFLLTFLIHIGCLGSVFYSFFVSDTNDILLLHVIIMLIVLLTSLYLIYTFPGPKEKEKDGISLFFTGAPVPSFAPIAAHDLTGEQKVKEGRLIENLNFFPIVRMFYVQISAKGNIQVKEGDKLHILLTREINCEKIKLAFENDRIPQMFEGKTGSEEAVKQFNGEFNKLKKIEIDNGNYKEIVAKYIKILAKYAFCEYSELCEVIEHMDIYFTPPVNYNDFDACYHKAKYVIEEYESNGDRIILNCSPGTTTVSSALTLLSMQANRKLLYYSQDRNIEIEYKMQEIMENKLDFKELIENISDELSNEKVS